MDVTQCYVLQQTKASTTRRRFVDLTTVMWYSINAIGKSNPIQHLWVTIPQVKITRYLK